MQIILNHFDFPPGSFLYALTNFDEWRLSHGGANFSFQRMAEFRLTITTAKLEQFKVCPSQVDLCLVWSSYGEKGEKALTIYTDRLDDQLWTNIINFRSERESDNEPQAILKFKRLDPDQLKELILNEINSVIQHKMVLRLREIRRERVELAREQERIERELASFSGDGCDVLPEQQDNIAIYEPKRQAFHR